VIQSTSTKFDQVLSRMHH